MKIKPGRADAFARQPDRGVAMVVVHGPDAGLVAERSDQLVRAYVRDPDDPFCVVQLSPAELSRNPASLADEAAAMPFGGGVRVVRVRDADDSTVKALKTHLDAPAPDSFVVLTAGELSTRSKLRQLAEKAGNAAALPCYQDEGRGLAQLAERILGEHGLSISRDALAHLTTHLGSDRQVTRRELEKLALYVGSGRVEPQHVQACLGDTAAVTLDDLAFACGDGDTVRLERAFQRAVAEGAHPVQIVRRTARHFQRLHTVAATGATESAADALRPPVFWKHKRHFLTQANAWPMQRLGVVIRELLQAEITLKTGSGLAETRASRYLLRIARQAPAPR